MTMKNRTGCMIIALLLCGAAPALAQTTPPAPAHVPLQKTIGQAGPDIVPSLIVMNARGASLQGGTLTLTGVAPNSIVFADRPVRAAGHSLTTHLLEEWSPSNASDESFAKDPPNATISVFSTGRIENPRRRRGAEDGEARGRPADLRRRCTRRRTNRRRWAGCALHRPLRVRRLSRRRLPRRRLRRLPRRWLPRRLRSCRGCRCRPCRRCRRLAPSLRRSRRLVSRELRYGPLRSAGCARCGGGRCGGGKCRISLLRLLPLSALLLSQRE